MSLLGFVIIGVLVCTALGSLLLKNAFATDSNFASSSSGSNSCGTSAPSGLAIFSGPWSPFSGNGSREIAFIMTPDSVAHICVTYSLTQGATPTTGETTSLSSSMYLVKATAVRNGESLVYAYSYSAAPGISVTESQASISDSSLVSGGSTTIVYTIRASDGLTGYYGLSFTNSCPSVILFAVTSNGGAVNSSNFPGLTAPSGCRVEQPLNEGQITGYDGVQVTSIGETP